MENNILFINASVRENSRTKELADTLLSTLKGNIETVDLYKEKLSPIDMETLSKRDLADFSDDSFAFAKQFAKADTIVIAAPFWDLSFPSVLKVYFENITVSSITFRYSEKGFPVSLCKAKKLYYVTTSGGFIGKNNYGFEYVKALAESFFGIDEILFYSAEGLDIFGAPVDEIMNEAKKKIINER